MSRISCLQSKRKDEKAMSEIKMCEMCNVTKAAKGIKYCSKCKFKVLAQLRKAGYLDSDFVPRQRSEQRDRSQRPSTAIGCDYHADAREEDF